MNNFKAYITPQQAKDRGDKRSLEKLTRLAKNSAECMNCDEPVWNYADTGLCFSCTTGEADASDDYELIEG